MLQEANLPNVATEATMDGAAQRVTVFELRPRSSTGSDAPMTQPA